MILCMLAFEFAAFRGSKSVLFVVLISLTVCFPIKQAWPWLSQLQLCQLQLPILTDSSLLTSPHRRHPSNPWLNHGSIIIFPSSFSFLRSPSPCFSALVSVSNTNFSPMGAEWNHFPVWRSVPSPTCLCGGWRTPILLWPYGWARSTYTPGWGCF